MSVKILLVDDDKILSKGVSLRLEKRGFEVTLVHSGEEGISKINNNEFDLVLLDIEMPTLNGVEVLNHIRKQYDKNILPIIMVSGNEEDGDIVEALKLGANDYVTKPINLDVLNARITTQVELRELSQEFGEKKEHQAINAIITTYNHEINNPLTISFGMLHKMKKDKEYSEETFNKLENSLIRIKDIVQKIRELNATESVDFQSYIKDSKMLKL